MEDAVTPFDAWVLPAGGPEIEDLETIALDPADVEARFPVWRPDRLADLCTTLRARRARALDGTPVDDVASVLGAVGARFLQEDDELRREALSLLPAYAGVSPPMAREIVDGMARDWTTDRLRMLLRIELDDPTVLDRFRPDPRTPPGGRRMVRAGGPGLGLHVCASTVPGVSVTSMIRGLLVKSAVVLKPGRSDLVLPVLFVRGLRKEAPELADCVAVSYWPGGTESVEDVLLGASDAVVVYGRDEVVRRLRDRTPVTRTFVSYRHRVGAVLVGREGLASADEIADRVARAIALFDQRGCVSPHVVYVEGGGAVEPEEWSEQLAESLGVLEDVLPTGPLLPSEASTIQQLRGTWEMRAGAEDGVSVYHGGRDGPWTVLVEPDPGFEVSCTGRVVRVRPVRDLDTAVAELAPVGEHLQTISLEGVDGKRRLALAESLARLGAVRITTAAESPWPPPWWHHDGGGALRSLLRWTDLEGD